MKKSKGVSLPDGRFVCPQTGWIYKFGQQYHDATCVCIHGDDFVDGSAFEPKVEISEPTPLEAVKQDGS